MRIQEGVLTIGDKQLSCLRMGQGTKLLLAFHGFGQDASAFVPLANLVSEEFTTISFNFPGESRSSWQGKIMPSNKTLWPFIQKLCDEFEVKDVTLMGFSMGGRPTMCLTEYYPEKVNRIILIAPDGLKKNIWYRLATREFYGRLIFKRILKKPQPWIRRANYLMDKGIIPSKWRNLVNTTLNKADYRKKLETDWLFTHNFIPNSRRFKKVLSAFNIPCHLFMGKQDRIFPPKEGEAFAKGSPFVHFHLLSTGHQILESNDALLKIADTLKE